MSWTVSDVPARPGSGGPSSSWVIEPLEDGADSRWTAYYSEKRIGGPREYFDSEDGACRWAVKTIEEELAQSKVPLHVMTDEEQAASAEARRKFFEKMNVPDWK